MVLIKILGSTEIRSAVKFAKQYFQVNCFINLGSALGRGGISHNICKRSVTNMVRKSVKQAFIGVGWTAISFSFHEAVCVDPFLRLSTNRCRQFSFSVPLVYTKIKKPRHFGFIALLLSSLTKLGVKALTDYLDFTNELRKNYISL